MSDKKTSKVHPKTTLRKYQKDISNDVSEAALENKIEVRLEGNQVITSTDSVFMISPLGSGKTRIASYTISLLLENPKFNIKIIDYDLERHECKIEKTIDTKILIFVPSSIVSQWVDELDEWDFNYYQMITPKKMKKLSEIDEKVILISDYRTKDISKVGFLDRKDIQFYIFIDEFDTIKFSKGSFYNLLQYTKTKISISANYTTCDINPIPTTYNEHKVFKITQDTIDKVISIPKIIECKFEYSLSSIFENLKDYLPIGVYDLAVRGNFAQIFKLRGMPTMNILEYFDDYLTKTKNLVDSHVKMIGGVDYWASITRNSMSKIKEYLITTYTKECHACKESIQLIYSNGTISQNCYSCFEFFCPKCISNNKCIFCNETKEIKISKSRISALDKILTFINVRTPEKPKKVLVYCAEESLVEVLASFLDTYNYWNIKLDGSAHIRRKKIEKFLEADTNIYLVCNSIQSSAGIHLPAATDIIIFHELDDKYDTQVIGRAQRIGRTESLYIHRIEALKSKD